MVETLACLIDAFVDGQWFYLMIAMKHVRAVVGLGLGLGFVGFIFCVLPWLVTEHLYVFDVEFMLGWQELFMFITWTRMPF